MTVCRCCHSDLDKTRTRTLLPSVAESAMADRPIASLNEDHTAPRVQKQHVAVIRQDPHPRPRAARKPVYASDKKAICELHSSHPGITHQQIADRIGVNKTTVTRILQRKERWLRSRHVEGLKFARKRVVKYTYVEEGLQDWLGDCMDEGKIVTDKMIRDKALVIAEDEGMRGGDGGHPVFFHCGRTWLRKFKERFGIIDGVPTRLGYTATDLARERAYGYFPLDLRFWAQLPDEHGNIPEPPPITRSKLDDMDREIHGPFVILRPRAAPASTSQPEMVPPDSTLSPNDHANPSGMPGPSVIPLPSDQYLQQEIGASGNGAWYPPINLGVGQSYQGPNSQSSFQESFMRGTPL
ncbi:uncharacterized protein B0H18DRAFT_518867 [Fomitopsis serialis]|uniref:uncharacterized protein n=1 Tax=Fomitopsis serialis TaxID=139415 RepID=UPI002008D5E5|nr:uncharacterized protein B0H18DRAFT_518867 [Neoantrodia serialis]KAH9922416.1 hypothetical protein B0H18DRAFT_518867 [Neoantrodia serialis]